MTEEFSIFSPPDSIEFHNLGKELKLIVNGRDLIETLRHVEQPYAAWEGSRGIAGRYCGLQPSDVLPPNLHFFGEPSVRYFGEETKVPLFCCKDCGDHECWTLLVRISIEGAVVIWSGFEQPRRKKWKYKDLLFRFDLPSYEASLNAALV